MNRASYLLVGAKGGCGTTTLAIDLAKAIRRANVTPTVVDADLSGRRAIAEMLGAMRALDANRIGTIHSVASVAGVDVVELVARYEDVAGLRASELETVAADIADVAGIALVDVPRPLEHFVAPFVRRATRIVVVVEADLLGASAARVTVNDLTRFGVPRDRFWLVVNDRNRRRTIESRELEKFLEIPIVAEIPRSDDRRAYERTFDALAKRVVAAPETTAFFQIPSLARLANASTINYGRRRADLATVEPAASNARESVVRHDPSDDLKAQRLAKRDRFRRNVSDLMIGRVDLIAASTGHSDGEKMRELRDRIDRLIDEVMHERADFDDFTLADRAEVKKEILDEHLGLGPLEELMRDPTVSEILVNGPEKIFVERSGRLTRSERSFASARQLRLVIERIVAPLGRRIDEASPMVDARLPDGSRVNAIIEPLAIHGASLTIRRFGTHRMTIDDLARIGSVPPEAVPLLAAIVAARLNVIVSGGTGSGKTTFLGVLARFIPAAERIVTIEDAAELSLDQDDVVSLEARPPNIEDRGAVTIRDLVRNALRMRPDRIVVGECRGGEAFDMLQAMNTGHDGSMTSLHANSARDALARLETLVLMAGFDLPIRAVREQTASAIDIVIHVSRFRDGTRKVASIAEVVGMRDGEIHLAEIVTFRTRGVDADGRVLGAFAWSGREPQIVKRFTELGVAYDPTTLEGLERDVPQVVAATLVAPAPARAGEGAADREPPANDSTGNRHAKLRRPHVAPRASG